MRASVSRVNIDSKGLCDRSDLLVTFFSMRAITDGIEEMGIWSAAIRQRAAFDDGIAMMT